MKFSKKYYIVQAPTTAPYDYSIQDLKTNNNIVVSIYSHTWGCVSSLCVNDGGYKMALKTFEMKVYELCLDLPELDLRPYSYA